MDLIEGLYEQIERARRLKDAYEDLPSGVGAVGSSFISGAIKKAEQSIKSGDVIEMLAAYGVMKELE